jgi:hypothetical protein
MEVFVSGVVVDGNLKAGNRPKPHRALKETPALLIRLGITPVLPDSLDKSKHRLVPNRAHGPV